MGRYYSSLHLRLISEIHTKKNSIFENLFFSSSVTASAVCLFLLDKQFYEVFTSSSLKPNRPNDIPELVSTCSQTIPSTIDRDMVETEKEFSPYLSNPLLIETNVEFSFHIYQCHRISIQFLLFNYRNE